MDYLIVTISSILFPYILSLSGIDYKADLGLKGSYQNFNKYSISLLKGEDNDKRYIAETSIVSYRSDSIKPDLFVDYSFSKPKSRFFMAASFGVEPFDSGMQVVTKRKETQDGAQTEEIHYLKDPYIALKVGYSILKNNPQLNGYGAFGITPYVIAGIMPITYQDGGNYRNSNVTKYTTYWGLGSKINFQGPWSFYLEYRDVKVDGRGSQMKYQVSLREKAYQFGFSYWLTAGKTAAQLNAQKNYSAIIKEINKNNGANAGAQHQVYSADTKKINTSANKNAETNNVISTFGSDLTKNSNIIKEATDKKVEGLYNLE